MKIREQFSDINGTKAWEIVVDYTVKNNSFRSVTGIRYGASFVGKCIFIKGGTPNTKRAEEGEYLTRKDFVTAYDAMRTLPVINTAKVKPYIKRQQTPFIGLLYSSGIIEL